MLSALKSSQLWPESAFQEQKIQNTNLNKRILYLLVIIGKIYLGLYDRTKYLLIIYEKIQKIGAPVAGLPGALWKKNHQNIM